MKQSIYSLAHEDDSELYSTGSGEITPEDMIESQADHDEFLETAASAQTDIAAIEESDEIVEDASDVAEDIDDKLEQPEKVTGDDVMVAQESMRIICHRYGIAPEAVLGRRLSHESASVNPVHSLRLAREETDGFIKSVIEGIRNIFKRLIVTIKKLYAKAVIALSRTEKVAENLIKKLDDYGEAPADAKFDDKEIAKIGNNLGAVIIIEGSKLGKDPVGILSDYITILKDAKYLSIYTDALKVATSSQIAVFKAPAEKQEEAINNSALELSNKFASLTPPRIIKKAIPLTGDTSKFKSNSEGLVIPFAINGKNIRAFVLYGKGKINSTTVTVKPEALKNIIVDIPSKASIRDLLKEVAATAKKAKDFEAAATKEVNEADKLLADLAKEAMKAELTGAVKRTISNFSSAVRIVTANVAVDSILAQVGGTRSILAYCAIAVKKLSKDKK
jgi:hypothetical protein